MSATAMLTTRTGPGQRTMAAPILRQPRMRMARLGSSSLPKRVAMLMIATISTMETFQRIYRPEIYNANAAAGAIYRPSLNHHDYSLTRIVYDREERSRLALEQGKFIEDTLIKPHRTALEEWSFGNAA